MDNWYFEKLYSSIEYFRFTNGYAKEKYEMWPGGLVEFKRISAPESVVPNFPGWKKIDFKNLPRNVIFVLEPTDIARWHLLKRATNV